LFIVEYEAWLKLKCNFSGFSNPIKKNLFNSSFHKNFSCEYKYLIPMINGLWEVGREKHDDPINFVAYGLIKYCESTTGINLEIEDNVDFACTQTHNLFNEIQNMIKVA